MHKLKLSNINKLPQWRFDVFLDQTTRLSGTAGTFHALNALNGDRTTAGTGVQLPFSVTAQLMRRRGVGVEHTQLPIATAWGFLDIRTGVRVFSVNQFRAVDAAGTVTESMSGKTQLQAIAQDHQLGGTSLYINPEKHLATGVALNAELTLRAADTSYLTLAIADVGPPMTIAHVLQTNRHINTNTVSYDANGYVQFAPIVNGKYTDVPYKAKQYPSYTAQGAVDMSKAVQLLGRVQSSYPITQYGGGMQWRTLGGTHQWQALLYLSPDIPASRALSWKSSSFSISWRGDSLSASRAKIWGFEGRVSL